MSESMMAEVRDALPVEGPETVHVREAPADSGPLAEEDGQAPPTGEGQEAPPVARTPRVIGTCYAMTGLDCQPKYFTEQWPEIREWNAANIVACFNRDLPQHEWSLKYHKSGQRFAYLQRNEAAQECEGDWLCFLDTDMLFGVDVVGRLLMSLNDITARYGRCDVLTGLYTKREPVRLPLVHRYQKEREHWPHILEFPWEEPFRVDGCGGGLLIIKREALEQVKSAFGRPFDLMPDYQTEDLCFNKRCYDLGLWTWCDPRIRALHAYVTFAEPEEFKPQAAEAIAEAEAKGSLYRPVGKQVWIPLPQAAALVGSDEESLAVAIANAQLMAKHTPGQLPEIELGSLTKWHERGAT